MATRSSGPYLQAVTILGLSVILLQWLSRGETVPIRRPLRAFPAAVEGWTGRDAPLEQRIVAAVGVDDYLNRVYVRPGNSAAVHLYIGYYGRQRTGDSVHAPKHCLPGAGWRPVRVGYLPLALPTARSRNVSVNEYLIEKDRDRQLVLYWYQNRGRVIASEYAAKVWMVRDALLLNRTDGALVRLMAPVLGSEAVARAQAIEFAQAVFPKLTEFIPD